jgi:PII-like signaling protein
MHRARSFGLAGASVFRGPEGYGASSRIHSTLILGLSEDLPTAVVIVDREGGSATSYPRNWMGSR